MLQIDREVYHSLREIRYKLDNLQLMLRQEKVMCGDLLGVLAFMDQMIKLHEEYLKQLNLDAFKELSGISETYARFKGELRPEDIIPGDFQLLKNLRESVKLWKTGVERLMNAIKLRAYPVMVVSEAAYFLKSAENILPGGDMMAVYGNISLAYDYLGELVRFEGLPDNLRNKVLSIREIREGLSLYKEKIKSREVNPDRLREQIKEWISRLEAIERGLVPTGVQPLPPPPPLLPPSPPTREGLRITCGGRSYTVDLASLAGKALIIGRYDPGGRDRDVGSIPDALKIQEYQEDRYEPGDILYIFTNTQCRWGCPPDDKDCTHRHHVLLIPDPERNIVRIRYFPGAYLPVFYAYREGETLRPLEKEEELELKPGQTVYLGISGVYDLTESKRVTIAISVAGKVSRDTIIQW